MYPVYSTPILSSSTVSKVLLGKLSFRHYSLTTGSEAIARLDVLPNPSVQLRQSSLVVVQLWQLRSNRVFD